MALFHPPAQEVSVCSEGETGFFGPSRNRGKRVSENLDSELRELRKQIADDLSYKRKRKSARYLKTSGDFKLHRRLLILGGAGLIGGIAVLILLSGDKSNGPTKNPTSTKRSGMSQLEERILTLEGIEDKIGLLEKQEKELQQSLVEMDRAGRSLRQQVNELSHVVDKLQKSVASGAVKTEPARPSQMNLGPPAKRLSRTEAPPTIGRMPFALPERRYHQVRPGECLSLIAERYGFSVDELCKLNHITPNRVIRPGQKLLVALGNRR